MIIYADVLVFVNSIVDYFLLLLTARLNKTMYKKSRLIFGALFGGFTSLYIFVSFDSVFFDLLFKSVFSLFMVLISFGFKNLKFLISNFLYLLASTFIYAGVILAIWQIFGSDKIFIKNSTVYYDVSVIFLLVCSVLIYIVITIAGSLIKKNAVTADKSKIIIRVDNAEIQLNAIYDTGNSLTDLFGDREIILTDEYNFKKTIDNIGETEFQKRFRVIPCNTVNGSSILQGVRCDSMTVFKDDKKYVFNTPILYQSATPFTDDFNAILNSEILTKMR